MNNIDQVNQRETMVESQRKFGNQLASSASYNCGPHLKKTVPLRKISARHFWGNVNETNYCPGWGRVLDGT